MNTSTPIINAVRAMHSAADAEDDKRLGFDPYNTLARREADIAAVSAAARQEALWILACYETELTLKE